MSTRHTAIGTYVLHQSLSVLSFAHVTHQARDSQTLPSQSVQGTVHVLLLPTADDHLGTVLAEPPGDGQTDAVGGRNQ